MKHLQQTLKTYHQATRGYWLTALLAVLFASGVQAAPADFSDVVESTIPAVVNIETTRFGERPDPDSSQRRQMPEDMPEFFRRFFDPEGGGMPRGRPDRQGGGSGFIISEDGLIVTNHHVIDEADEIVVRLSDRSEYVAELVGSDEETDVALLRIDADNLPTLEFGNSNALRPGEWVIAIGSPFQFEQSVTAGIVSAKGRSQDRQQYVPFIQSDVAINRGNSGGPLINRDGQVVGINSWILSASGGNIGLSFSIPIETAENTIDQLQEYGRVSRGYLGVGIQPVDRQKAEAFGLDRPIGALVNQVQSGSAAEKAGVKVGDVIVRVNNKEVSQYSDLPPIVGSIRPGEQASLGIVRNGKDKTIDVTLDEHDEDVDTRDEGPDSDSEPTNALGITVKPLTDQQRERLDGAASGVVVARIESDDAYRAGVRRGDLIQMIDGQSIESVDDFDAAVAGIDPAKTVALLIWRNGTSQFVAYKPGSAE